MQGVEAPVHSKAVETIKGTFKCVPSQDLRFGAGMRDFCPCNESISHLSLEIFNHGFNNTACAQ